MWHARPAAHCRADGHGLPVCLNVSPLPPPRPNPQITAEVKNVLGTVGSGVQEVIANTKGTVAGLFGKGATTSTPSFSMT